MDSCAGTEEDFAGIYPQPRGHCKLVEQEAIRENAFVLKYYERKITEVCYDGNYEAE